MKDSVSIRSGLMAATVVFAAALSATVLAQAPAPAGGGQGRGGPPPLVLPYSAAGHWAAVLLADFVGISQ